MEKHLFYVPEINPPESVLPEDESRHCIKVLRLRQGDEILITDGKGKIYSGDLMNEDPREARVSIIEEFRGRQERKYHLHIAIAPTKNISRLEWFLEKSTEIGVDEITPVFCENSERKIIKPARLEKIIMAAAKQSLTATFPRLNEARNLFELLSADHLGEKFIAYLSDESSPLKTKYPKGSNVLILVGPEGDFTENEVERAVKNDFEPVTLGHGRLRTETAGVVACHTVALINED